MVDRGIISFLSELLNVFVHILENIKYTVTTTTGISLCCQIDSAFCKEIAITWVYMLELDNYSICTSLDDNY